MRRCIAFFVEVLSSLLYLIVTFWILRYNNIRGVMSMEKLVIIDGNSLINRAFYALPVLSNKDGEFSNAVYGFTTMLIKTIEDHKPTHIVVAFDYGKRTFRHDMYSDYKAGRKETPAELKSQFPILKRLLSAMNIQMYEREGIEADDIIGTLARKYKVPTIIVTGDRDALQLIDDSTEVWLTKRGISEVKLMNEKTFHDEYGFDPIGIIDLKSLMGDSSDNIPGVPGIGEKTAMTLMHDYNNLDGVYANIENISGKLKEKLINGRDMAYLSKALATIDTTVPIESKLSDFEFTFPFSQEVFDIFTQYQFNSLLKRPELFGDSMVVAKDDSKVESKQIQVKDIQSIVSNAKRIGIIIGESSINFAIDKLVEYTINCELNLFNVGAEHSEALSKLKSVLEDKRVEKVFYDSKDMRHKLANFGINVQGKIFDCMLASYLINAGDKTPKWPNIAEIYGLNTKYNAVNLIKLVSLLEIDLDKNNLRSLYEDIELPLVDVLYDMENTGFTIDKKVLDELSDRYSCELQDLTKVIYSLAGTEFNINSPKQLGEVLFDKLGLEAYNNKKKSTGIDILEEISDRHPVVPLIIRYRKIQKLSTTYLESYLQLVSGNRDKIHTIFNQALTATGRLSSSEPNLQNIPVRDDEGKVLRKMFVPSNPEGFLVSADYSQIELRLLAHFSHDPLLVEAYNTGKDIHAQTASEVFGVPFGDVTPLMRRNAKAVNFGIIYGISEFGLAQNIGCSRKDAKKFMEIYFERYPMVKKYMQDNVEFAKAHGYISTMMGRIRKINELRSPNYMTRQFGERISMNMPLQGTASDIIKIAMIKVYNRLKAENLKSKLILQIHDELIIDTEPNELGVVTKILREEMENAVKLNVPLTVDVNAGKDWYECK